MSTHPQKRARTDADVVIKIEPESESEPIQTQPQAQESTTHREVAVKQEDGAVLSTDNLVSQLRKDLHSSANKVRRYQERSNRLSAINQSLQDESNELRNQIDELEEQLQKKQQDEIIMKNSQEIEINKLRTQVQDLIHSKTLESEKYKSDLQNLQSELNKTKEDKNNEYRRMNSENEKLRAEARLLSESYKKATTKQKNEHLDFILKMEVKMDEVKAELEKQREAIRNEGVTVQDDSQELSAEVAYPNIVENASGGKTNTSEFSRNDRNSERELHTTGDRTLVPRGNSRIGHTFQVSEEYRIEIQRRVKEEYNVALSKMEVPNSYNWKAVCATEKNCHICHARKPKGVVFSCGQHFYCESHLKARFNVSGKEFCSDPEKYDICPVCCLTCVCSKCKRKLDSVAGELQTKCIEVRKKPIETEYKCLSIASGFIWSKTGLTKIHPSQQHKKRGVIKPPIIPAPRRIIASSKYKIPKEAFPHEVYQDQDIDPSSNDDYSFVWGESGKIGVLEETCDKPNFLSNMDFCIKCEYGGDIISCNKCPRSFHAKCIKVCANTLPDTWLCTDCIPDTWLCTDCIKDNRFDESTDLVEGEYNRAIFNQFSSAREMMGSIDFDKKMKTLYKLHEIVLKLINFDFGKTFASPVDANFVQDYLKWVTNPMDLGTVRDQIINGDYVKQVFNVGVRKEQFENLFEELIFTILKDIETIWHNCFIYNEPGSMHHRMGLVQRKKFMKLRKHNIDSDLTEETKEKLLKVVQDFSDERLRILKGEPNVSDFTVNLSDHKTGTFAHIFEANKDSLTSSYDDIIAVFDPDTRVVVKMYNSWCSAASAAMNLYQRGFPCEIDGREFSEKGFTDFVKKSKNDSTLTCFGYRWLLFSDLQGGVHIP